MPSFRLRAAASALFSFRNQQRVLVPEAGVAAVAPISFGRIFVDQQTAPAGLALANPSSSPVVVELTLINSRGEEEETEQRTIPAQSQIAKFVSELFPSTGLSSP